MADFNELGLSPEVLDAVARLGYEMPTPVQEQAIPLVLEGRDLIAAAKTGTGKTAAFSLPALDGLGHAKGGQGPLMLVVTPTRELAQQIGEVCARRGRVHPPPHSHRGGRPVLRAADPEAQARHRRAHRHARAPRGPHGPAGPRAWATWRCSCSTRPTACWTWAFWPSMRKIIGATPASRQTLLFSATIDRSIMGSVGKLLHDPAMVEIAHKGETADTVEQFIVRAPQTLKPALLKAVLAEKGHERVIVFARTRSRADATCRRLKKAGYTAEAIHSDRSQNQRRRALDNFMGGTTDVLVATDVLARGIDVESVDHVINYDLPTVPEDYVHRIGRTGRAGEEGWAISFVSPETEDALRDIQKLIKREIPEMEIATFDEQEALAEAAAHATRKAARTDPEIAQAAREMAKRERKKERAREAAAEGAQDAGGRGQGGKKRAAKKPAGVAGAQPNRQRPAQKGPKKPAAGATAKAGKGQPKAQPSARKPAQGASGRPAQPKQQAAKGSSAAKPARGGADLRPGRAHRADVAKHRGKQR